MLCCFLLHLSFHAEVEFLPVDASTADYKMLFFHFSFLFFGSTGVSTQGFALAR
jgi:hypothetical protein